MARGFAQSVGAGGRVRLRTLSNLRWLAVAGQSAALFLVYFALGYPLPILYCATAIAVSGALNIALALRYPPAHRLTNREATFYLAFDVLQLAALLYLTGGIANPFALMFLAPVVIAAATLNLGNVLILAFIAFASVSVIAVVHRPLPWPQGDALLLPQLYQAGIWTALVIGIGFTSVYAWRIASESSRMSAGLAATQLALSREHRLAALGALATAAAHELGTPLGTIAVVARELERSLPANSTDAGRRQAAARTGRALPHHHRPPGQSGRSHAGRHRPPAAGPLPGRSGRRPSRRGYRDPHHRHPAGKGKRRAPGLARARTAAWPGQHHRECRRLRPFPGGGARRLGRSSSCIFRWPMTGRVLRRKFSSTLGEPYITSRPGRNALGENDMGPQGPLDEHEGMGLGFFIAKILLEQTGGVVKAENPAGGGAQVSIRWARGVIDGPQPPTQSEAG